MMNIVTSLLDITYLKSRKQEKKSNVKSFIISKRGKFKISLNTSKLFNNSK